MLTYAEKFRTISLSLGVKWRSLRKLLSDITRSPIAMRLTFFNSPKFPSKLPE